MLSKILGVFNGPRVEAAGVLLSVLFASLLLHGAHRVAFISLVVVYVANRFRPIWFNFVHSFAEPDTWPGYVALAIAVCVAAHAFGGWRAALSVAFVFAIGDGRLFPALY